MGGSIRVTPYVVVRDMWWLDENRSRLYKRFGISSERLDQLHHYANEHLDQAEIALKKGVVDSALQLARSAWGYESLAYPDVKKTGNDVVNGVMFWARRRKKEKNNNETKRINNKKKQAKE